LLRLFWNNQRWPNKVRRCPQFCMFSDGIYFVHLHSLDIPSLTPKHWPIHLLPINAFFRYRCFFR
jgi:hypothetical protein